MNIGDVRLKVVFFRTGSGTEPVRRWLKSLSRLHKKAVGEDFYQEDEKDSAEGA
jgi:vacuolar-type H+-ATPase subunit B/Vma2